MPPKKGKQSKASKKKVAVEPEPVEEASVASEEEDDGIDDPNIVREGARGYQDDLPSGATDTEELIASFFEDRPYFYDLTHEAYKNKRLRASELADFAKSLGPKWDGKCQIT